MVTDLPILSRERFVDVALEVIDSSGIDSLTLKGLGQQFGASHTAIYRYFHGIPDLLVSVRARLVGEIDVTPLTATNPRDRIVEIASRFRDVIKNHPNAAPLFLIPAEDDESIASQSIAVVRELEKLGFSGDLLTTSWQILEAYVMGGTVWDFAGSPNHYITRLRRLRQLRHEAFDKISREEDSFAEYNERSFRLGVESIIDGLIARLS